MSETSSPKPKPGSLRDRIAAFENANKSAAPSSAPPPRPKPSTLQSWKPKVPSPPHSPEPDRKSGGMSASDAMESIGKGVSLKERMAALQGKGAFGGVAPTPAPPKPADKPKWKPPPRPLSPPADGPALIGEVMDAQRCPSLPMGDPDQAEEGDHEAQQDAAETEHDPEEEERQRRAAIAARMARLGGARVGMGLPVFGGKPAPKKPETPPAQPQQEEEASAEPIAEVISPSMEGFNPVSSAKEEARTDSDHFPGPARQDSGASSLSLADPTPDTVPSRSPSAMPVPAGPRRAAPPRKKAYKSPSASQPSEAPAPTPVPEATEEVPDVTPTAEPAAESTSGLELESVAPPSPTKVTPHETAESPEQVSIPSSEEVLVVGDVQQEIDESAEIHTTEVGPVDEHEGQHVSADELRPAPEQDDQDGEEEEEEKEEEEERRRRVAAKLSQMGAINPLARPPPVPRRESIPSPIAGHDSVSASVPTNEPLDVEDEVNVDLEEVGESVSTPVPARISPQAHVKEPEEAREVDEPASRAAESDGESQPDLGTTRRVLYYDEVDEEEQYGDQPGRDLNDPVGEPGLLSTSEAHYLDTNILSHTPSAILHEDRPSEEHLIGSETSAQVPSTDIIDSAGSYNAFEVPIQQPQQDQDDDDMAPARITRPVPPPPINLSSKPSISLPSPPPTRTPLYALHADEDRPESPAPRPVPPPVKSVKAAQEAAPAPPARIARRTSISVKSVDMEAPPTPRPPTSPRPPVRRPTSPPIITALPLIVPAPESEEDVEREFVDSETPSQPQVQESQEENEEALRRRTIVERMARLGGIRFGAPPVPTPLSRPTFPRAPPPTSIPPDEPTVDTEEPIQDGVETEEDEAARKERIAARLAGMGGMRFGMLPPGAGVAPATTRWPASRQDDSENEDAALPVPAPAPPPRRPPPPVEVDSEQEQSRGTSDDGIRVELEESEIEEVYYSDAEARASFEEETPPPPPVRRSSATMNLTGAPISPPRMTSRSPPPVGRPPVPCIPVTLLNRRPSAAASLSPSSRKSSIDYSSSSEAPTQKQRMPPTLESVLSKSSIESQSEYVIVEPLSAPEEEPLAPPRRRSLRAPPRAIPPPPAPPPSAIDPPEEMVGSVQWELPSIPQVASEFSDEGDLGSSRFSEDSTFHESSSPSTRKSQSRRTSGQTTRPADQQLSVDELMTIWGKVGVQVVDSATKLFEKSKRSLVGDGSYAGFVRDVIAQVPNAQRDTGDGEDWGYLIYAQTASSVQRRVAEIMPGDVIAFWDAKLKGHKGLQTYNQSVGAGANGPLLGVVSEVEGKKSKVRVWQANQHVGQQTVENVSYRLEDLKSGHVKVFRVMEA